MKKAAGHIFLVGPGGTGKSTLGPVLAAQLNYGFVDLDHEFCQRVLPIPDFIETRGYAPYCDANAQLARQLATASTARLVMATSSGFLAHDEQPHVIAHNLALIQETGISVLVLPDEDDAVSSVVIAQRQSQRHGPGSYARWLAVTTHRLPMNRDVADLEVIADGSPTTSAQRVVERLAAYASEPAEA